MQIYWTSKSIPELKDMTAKEQKMLWRTCSRSVFKHPLVYLGLAIVGIFAGASYHVGFVISRAWYGFPEEPFSFVIVFLIGSVGAGIGGFIYGQIVTFYIRPYLREKIRAIQNRDI